MIEFQPLTEERIAECIQLVLMCIDDMGGMEPAAMSAFSKRIQEKVYAERLLKSSAIVAVENGQVVGMGALNECDIQKMYVHPTHRHRGIARSIHAILENKARQQGLTRLKLESTMNAVGFYQRLGYQTVRENRWHIGGGEVINLIMDKDL